MTIILVLPILVLIILANIRQSVVTNMLNEIPVLVIANALLAIGEIAMATGVMVVKPLSPRKPIVALVEINAAAMKFARRENVSRQENIPSV